MPARQGGALKEAEKSARAVPLHSKYVRPEWVSLLSVIVGVFAALYLVGALGVAAPFGLASWSTISRIIAFIGIALGIKAFSATIIDDVLRAYTPISPTEPARRLDLAASDEPPEAPVLERDEDRIHTRLEQIAEHRARIESVTELVEHEMAGVALAQVREKLDFAESVLKQQESRHHAQLWTISLVRWQHRLAGLTNAVAGAAPGEARKRLKQLSEITGEGGSLLAEWEAHEETAATREGSRCVEHLRELLGRCEQLRQGIVVQEAMLTIRGIDPADNVERASALSIEPVESLQTDLGEGGSLTRALAELELEHDRLREDDQATRSVERFLGDLESGRA